MWGDVGEAVFYDPREPTSTGAISRRVAFYWDCH